MSCEKNFITEAEKHYFVFTDSLEIEFEADNKNIHRIYQENLGWPGNTLRRYEMFLKAEKEITGMDFLFFFNSNLLFLENITAAEFLPSGDEKLVACLHPGFYNKTVKDFTYERNPHSTAYLKDGKHYFAGGINGGLAGDFIAVMKELDTNIKKDFSKNIIATWHDESHWNKYINGHLDLVKIISPAYLYLEDGELPFAKRILIRDKNKYGGHFNLRGKFEWRLLFGKIKTYIKNIIKKFKPMKIIKISGGLGNQMFQYAYGRSLQVAGKKIIFDTSFYNGNWGNKDTPREFKLDAFNVSDSAVFSDKNHKILSLIGKIKKGLGIKVEEYYQNEKYFKNIENFIKQEFTLKNPMSATAVIWSDKIKSAKNSVLLHVRRGDYATNPITTAFHGLCSLEYYEAAINKIVEKLGTTNIKIFVFSDDIAWTKENIKFPYDIEFADVPEIQNYEKMIIMSLCEHDIIANSTFSWWPAWLNNNPNKIVVAPQQWFKNPKAAAKNDIVPSDWIKI